ncbi:MAG: short-chain dehydrogenase [Chitinophagaceae bacterium]|nr:short-chain dehydrogenase [Chitinophagaceae bacterium]
MTIEQIEKFVETERIPHTKSIKIDFKKRNSIQGLIIQGNDYSELKAKNFWRIVTNSHMKEWQKSKNVEFAKIFNGTEFTRLSIVANKEE